MGISNKEAQRVMFERESLSLMYDIVINLMKIIWLAKRPLQIFLGQLLFGVAEYFAGRTFFDHFA